MFYEDYVQTQMSFMKDLSLLLQRFARDLGDEASLTIPFMEDIEEIKDNVLNKKWTLEQRKMIEKTPGLLMTDVEFSKFQPQKNDWVYFSFNPQNTIEEIEILLKELASLVKNGQANILKEAQQMKQKQTLKKLERTVEIKPQLHGVSVNLKQALKILKEIKGNSKEKAMRKENKNFHKKERIKMRNKG